jgi:cephalosporin hydroxylase
MFLSRQSSRAADQVVAQTSRGEQAAPAPRSGNFREFVAAVEEHYPDWAATAEIDFVRKIVELEASGQPGRFVKSAARTWYSAMPPGYPWVGEATREKAHALTYKGFINAKTPFDLALYTRLLWELQPRTVLEFGSFHGGSGMWFADHLGILCREPGEVHSFDIHPRAVSTGAVHPRLHFHFADITNLSSLDTSLLERLPHPWLVIEDAHVNIANFVLFLHKFMDAGDYVVIEDVPALATAEVVQGFKVFDEAGFLIDTYYTDAYGRNVTCAPNAWLRKS